MAFLPSALNVKGKKFNETWVNAGRNYDSLKAAFESIVTNWASLQNSPLLVVLLDTSCNVTKSISAPARRRLGWPVQRPPVKILVKKILQ